MWKMHAMRNEQQMDTNMKLRSMNDTWIRLYVYSLVASVD